MNKTLIQLAALMGIVFLSACKEKKASQEIIVERQEIQALQAPIKMQQMAQSKDVRWMGQNYHIDITRTPSDSLHVVKDEFGQPFVDNMVQLTITKADGSVFMNRTFTKGSFSSYLNAEYREMGILNAFIFKEVDDNNLEFAVSVARPQSDDELIPLKMKIDRSGTICIEHDDDIDINGNNHDDDD